MKLSIGAVPFAVTPLGAFLSLGLAAMLAGPATAQAQDEAAETREDSAQPRQEAATEDRRISEYDFAVSQAMRALMEAGAEGRRVALYVARKEGELWHVYFGSFDFGGPAFGIAYEVVQEAPGSPQFEVQAYQPEQPADPELTRAAMALVTAMDAFEPRSVRFYTYVWRDENGRWITYFVPEAAASGRLGRSGDQRVVVSPDARRILESRFGPPEQVPWLRAGTESATGRDLVQMLLAPQYTPFALITRRLVCEMNWEGEIERCLVGAP